MLLSLRSSAIPPTIYNQLDQGGDRLTAALCKKLTAEHALRHSDVAASEFRTGLRRPGIGRVNGVR